MGRLLPLLCTLFVVFAAATAAVQQNNTLWPLPTHLSTGSKSVLVDLGGLKFTYDQKLPLVKAVISRYSAIFPLAINSLSAPSAKPAVLNEVVVIIRSYDATLNHDTDETYTLEVPSNGQPAKITSETVFGFIRAIETLSQLIEKNKGSFYIFNTPVKIDDQPRFVHRGLLLDTSRNYYSMPSLIRMLDAMSYSKFNVFHWHIVDSHSFPVQSELFPELSEKGAYSPREVYTKHDVEMIQMAGLIRGIRVIPEFDMPGHSYAWGLAFPNITVCMNAKPWGSFCNEPPCGQLNPIHPETYEVVNGLIDEMSKWFKDEIFHQGGDEVNMNCWNSDSSIQSFMNETGATTNMLLKEIVLKIQDKVLSTGKKSMVWEEMILQFNLPLPKDTIVETWISSENTKQVVEKGYRVVASSSTNWYLDCGAGNWVNGGTSWCDPFKTWQTVYAYNPTDGLNATQKHMVLGGEVMMWSEQADENSIEAAVWPRAAAAGERLWSHESVTDPIPARDRIVAHRQRLVARGIRAIRLQPQWCDNNPGQCA
eukprot:Colp12_sorted_trinity150504_noHs@16657